MSQADFAGYRFVNFGELNFERDKLGELVNFLPQTRYSKAALSRLHPYGHGPYCKFTAATLPATSGVYILKLDGVPIYIGRALNLRKRFSMGYGNISPRNCYVGGQQTNCRINQLILSAVKENKRIEIWALETKEYVEIEAKLLSQLQPRWNRAGILK